MSDAPNESVELRHDELARARNFSGGTFVTAVLGSIGQLTNTSRGWVGDFARVAVIAVALHAFVIWFQARVRKTFMPRAMISFGVTVLIAGFAIQLDVGMFSPIVAAGVLGLAFFSRSHNTRIVWTLALASIAFYAVFSVLIAYDVIADTGSFVPANVTRQQKLSVAFVTTGFLFASFLHGRLSRRSAMESLDLARKAALDAYRREAQLQEAQRELERALGGNLKDGRLTGLVVDGWVLGALLGRGGMGEVYAAKDESGRDAALKLLTSAYDEGLRERFRREVRIAMRLSSPNLVEVFASGFTAAGAPYLVMERLEGNDLAWHLRREQRFAIDRLLALVDQIATGLDVAHEAGVVHRDLKPQNLFFATGDEPRWKILDFGIATLETSSGTLTASNIVGTPAYMSPEQALGDTVTRRSDLFSFGSVIYRALTGAPPFPGSGAVQLLYAVAHEMPVRPRDLVPALPVDIEAVLAIALAKRPDDRFESASELASAFRFATTNSLPTRLREKAQRILARSSWRALKT